MTLKCLKKVVVMVSNYALPQAVVRPSVSLVQAGRSGGLYKEGCAIICICCKSRNISLLEGQKKLAGLSIENQFPQKFTCHMSGIVGAEE